MVIELLLGVFCLAMIWGGGAMVLYPAAFVGDFNPTLQLLKEHLPDWIVLRIVQSLGVFLVLLFLAFFFGEYVF